jgi:hypothetical protein
MTATRYASTDASAPVNTGQVGTLIAIIDAVGRTGYGSQPAQGMTKPFTGTNQAVFQWTAGNARFLNVIDDGATTAGAANYGRVWAAESETAQNTGTGLFPTTAQIAAPGMYFVKCTTADGTVRPWWAYGNQKILHLFAASDSSTTNPALGTLTWGDFTSYVSGDLYNTIIMANTTTTASISSTNNGALCLEPAYQSINAIGNYICRNWSGIGSSALVQKTTNNGFFGVYAGAVMVPIGSPSTNVSGSPPSLGAALVYPNGADSGLYMERLWLSTSTGTTAVHGEMPGMWCPLHQRPLNHLDTFSGTGNLSGKTFEVLSASGTASAMVFMETSNTW